ncbi:MAG: DNA repair protein RecO [Pseudomonadota bacterium]|nr:DNA repair protein RecO [Pseudomonadota bacterium]
MEWRDEGLVIGLKRLGESSSVLEAMTRAHGRHLGLVRGARSGRLAAALQPGNSVGLVWRARLDEHLGAYAVEPLTLRAGRFLPSALALAGVNLIGALLRLLPERDPHEALFDELIGVIEALDDDDHAPARLARFEARMLGECGFALDLSQCAATGARTELIYVSPKSGRAVSAGAGAPYRDKLLPLPAFLRDDAIAPDDQAIVDAFRLTGFFLERELFGPRGLKMPDARESLINAMRRRR